MILLNLLPVVLVTSAECTGVNIMKREHTRFDCLLLILICDLCYAFFFFFKDLCPEHKGFVSVSEYFCWHLM